MGALERLILLPVGMLSADRHRALLGQSGLHSIATPGQTVWTSSHSRSLAVANRAAKIIEGVRQVDAKLDDGRYAESLDQEGVKRYAAQWIGMAVAEQSCVIAAVREHTMDALMAVQECTDNAIGLQAAAIYQSGAFMAMMDKMTGVTVYRETTVGGEPWQAISK